MSDWISVEDRLPDVGVCCDVWFSVGDAEGRFENWFYNKERGYWWKWQFDMNDKSNIKSGVTHWMPLPEPPQ